MELYLIHYIYYNKNFVLITIFINLKARINIQKIINMLYEDYLHQCVCKIKVYTIMHS